MIPLISIYPEFSLNPPGSAAAPCLGCGKVVSLDERSVSLLALPGGEYEPWCAPCATARWPDLEVAGTEGVYVLTETFGGVEVGTIRVGRLRLRDWAAGARRVE